MTRPSKKRTPKSRASTSEKAAGTAYRATIVIRLRSSILDPQGKAVQHALESLGMGSIENVRIGKYIEMKVTGGSRGAAQATAEEACRRLLANPVMEDFSLALEKIGQRRSPGRRTNGSSSRRSP